MTTTTLTPQNVFRRSAFQLEDDLIYLDGNSLGPLPKVTQARVAKVVTEEWGQDLIQSWNKHDWFVLPEAVGIKIARLIGAKADAVTVCDSTSINLHKVLSAALQKQLHAGETRHIILTDEGNFPTDLYVAQSIQASLKSPLDYEIRTVTRADIEAEIQKAGEDLAVLMLTQVDYTRGHCYDIPNLTRLAQDQGALCIWDLAHSAGAVELKLADWSVDFAIGCGYKFLNGGPGAPAFLYVSPRHADTTPALQGWMGHSKPFAFAHEFTASQDIRRFRVGTPSIIALSALDASLSVFDGIDPADLHAKANTLIDLAIERLTDQCPSITVLTPSEHSERGSQLSIMPKDEQVSAYAIVQALIDRNIVGDFRQPNIARFGITPLYINERDITVFVDTLADIINHERWNMPEYLQKKAVT